MPHHKVKLYLYDLGEQLNAKLNLGLPSEKIWHSSIVVYGKEYSYGSDGITIISPPNFEAAYSKTTMGSTHVPEEQFKKYVKRLELSWTGETYNLVHKNCHNFSQLLVQYLDVSDIPELITFTPTSIRALTVEVVKDYVINLATRKYRSCESS